MINLNFYIFFSCLEGSHFLISVWDKCVLMLVDEGIKRENELYLWKIFQMEISHIISPQVIFTSKEFCKKMYFASFNYLTIKKNGFLLQTAKRIPSTWMCLESPKRVIILFLIQTWLRFAPLGDILEEIWFWKIIRITILRAYVMH